MHSIRRFSCRAACVAALAGAILSSACSSQEPAPTAPPPVATPAPAGSGQTQGSVPTQPAQPGQAPSNAQADVAIQAYIEGASLHIRALNRFRETLVIGPKNFAIIPAGSREAKPFPRAFPGFPVSKLKPGEQMTAALELSKLTVQAHNGKIAFSHPACRPSVAPIAQGLEPEIIERDPKAK